MKLLTKLSLIAATVAALGTSAAFADDQQLQNRLFLARQAAGQYRATTVAVYNVKGIGHAESPKPRAGVHYELRWNAHGQQFDVYVPNK